MNNLIEQYLIFAEGQANRRIPMQMKDWAQKLDGFLKLNDREILEHAGKISHKLAKEIAEKEYNKFNQKIINEPSQADRDFEEFVSKTTKLVEKNKN